MTGQLMLKYPASRPRFKYTHFQSILICGRQMHWISSVACIGAGGLIAQKVYMNLTTGMYKGTKRMDGKTVLVTGSNTGIGKEAARDLANRGARVILACRDLDKANAARDDIIAATGNSEVVVRHLDLASFASVRRFASEFVATEDKLHVLVNNAGLAGVGNARTEDRLLVGMQVNHYGPFLLTNLLIDLVKRSAPSRVIFVSSYGHKMAKMDVDNLDGEKGLSDTQVYCCSKLANVLTANELARRLHGSGVTVNSLHPGVVLTDIWRNLPSWLLPATNFVLRTFFKSSAEGAQTTIYMAVADEVEGVTGEYFVDCKKSEMAPAARDEKLAAKLWEKSERVTAAKASDDT